MKGSKLVGVGLSRDRRKRNEGLHPSFESVVEKMVLFVDIGEQWNGADVRNTGSLL